MKSRWKFLTVDQVLAIHRRVISEFGGNPAVLNEGLLESAVAMAPAQFGGRFLHKDGAAIAAAYLYHICRGHPFLDGNKRTAVVATLVFIRMNGSAFGGDSMELALWIEKAAANSANKATAAEFAAWLEGQIGPV